MYYKHSASYFSKRRQPLQKSTKNALQGVGKVLARNQQTPCKESSKSLQGVSEVRARHQATYCKAPTTSHWRQKKLPTRMPEAECMK